MDRVRRVGEDVAQVGEYAANDPQQWNRAMNVNCGPADAAEAKDGYQSLCLESGSDRKNNSKGPKVRTLLC